MEQNGKFAQKLGADLKEIREAQNKTLEDVSEKTKINVGYLECIENDEFDFLHTPYVLAFIKAYAKYLGLDQNEYGE